MAKNKIDTCEIPNEYPCKKLKKSKRNEPRTRPNLLITGTPGTGKSTLCRKLQEKLAELNWINVGEFAKNNGCLGDWDEQYECHELDEEKLLDELEEVVANGDVSTNLY